MSGGYDSHQHGPADAEMIRVSNAGLSPANGIDPVLLPRNAGSWPGYVLHRASRSTSPPATSGLGHGQRRPHAPDEYYVIESANPKVQGFRRPQTRSYVEIPLRISRDITHFMELRAPCRPLSLRNTRPTDVTTVRLRKLQAPVAAADPWRARFST